MITILNKVGPNETAVTVTMTRRRRIPHFRDPPPQFSSLAVFLKFLIEVEFRKLKMRYFLGFGSRSPLSEYYFSQKPRPPARDP